MSVSDVSLKQAKTLIRLDVAIVKRSLAATRSRARDLVLRGLVEVDGEVATKPGANIAPDALVVVRDDAALQVSRGAVKLAAALEHFRFPVAGLVALDVGASTGGFTEVLLSQGAARVYAVDVGHGQLHPRLAGDARVVSLESCDARALDGKVEADSIDAIVADVSFISLTLALPVPLRLTRPGAWLIALIKPQFEAGRAAVGKRGIVRDPALRQQAVVRVRDWVAAQPAWRVIDVIASPIAGGHGNAEFLLGAVRDE